MRYWPVYGGGETVTATLANEFAGRGHSVHIAYQYEHYIDPMPYSIDSSIKQVQLHTVEGYTEQDVQKVHEYIVQNNINVMINQWGSVRLCNAARKNISCKLVMCWHQEVLTKFESKISLKGRALKALGLYDWHERRWKINAHKRNTDNCDRYIFLTKAFADYYLMLTKGYNADKIGAIPNPLTYADFYDMEDYPKKEKTILFVGRIEEVSKRVSYVLKLWGMLSQYSYSDGWRLVIVGDGPDLTRMKNMAEAMGLKNLSFEGYSNPKPYYQKAPIFVMTSASEGFGMTLLEAQQNGCVPLAMDTYSSLHDIIEDGKNGYIIPENDFNTYVLKLKLLMTNVELRKDMAQNGLESSRRYGKASVVKQWEELFNEVVER